MARASFLFGDNDQLTPTEMKPDEAHYVDTQTLGRTKGDVERFRSIIDTLIDIVEKIEAYTPSV
jgi:hypothetical protein